MFYYFQLQFGVCWILSSYMLVNIMAKLLYFNSICVPLFFFTSFIFAANDFMLFVINPANSWTSQRKLFVFLFTYHRFMKNKFFYWAVTVINVYLCNEFKVDIACNKIWKHPQVNFVFLFFVLWRKNELKFRELESYHFLQKKKKREKKVKSSPNNNWEMREKRKWVFWL